MATAALRRTRWVATPVIALIGTLGVQVAVFRLTIELVDATVGIAPGSWVIWGVKAFTSVFMGAAFVALVCWSAPEWKLRAGAVALGVVVLWGGDLALGAFHQGFMAWLCAMGAAGVAGGACAFWMARRMLAVGRRCPTTACS